MKHGAIFLVFFREVQPANILEKVTGCVLVLLITLIIVNYDVIVCKGQNTLVIVKCPEITLGSTAARSVICYSRTTLIISQIWHLQLSNTPQSYLLWFYRLEREWLILVTSRRLPSQPGLRHQGLEIGPSTSLLLIPVKRLFTKIKY